MEKLYRTAAARFCVEKFGFRRCSKMAKELCLFTGEVLNKTPHASTTGMLESFLDKEWEGGASHRMLVERVAREYCQMLSEKYRVKNSVLPPSPKLVKKTDMIFETFRDAKAVWNLQLFDVFNRLAKHMGNREWESLTAEDVAEMKKAMRMGNRERYRHELTWLKKVCYCLGKGDEYEREKTLCFRRERRISDYSVPLRIVTSNTDAAVERLRQKYWIATMKGYKRPSETEEYIKLVRETMKKYNK